MCVLVATPHNVFCARFVDARVRNKAVEWLSRLEDDDICDFLPQLVQVCLCVVCGCMCMCVVCACLYIYILHVYVYFELKYSAFGILHPLTMRAHFIPSHSLSSTSAMRHQRWQNCC